MHENIRVRVVLAMRHEQVVVDLSVAPGTTAAEALRLARARAAWSEAAFDGERLGIFGRLVDPLYVLHEGDRVEVLRPLVLDPKEMRRRRAAATANRRSVRGRLSR